MYRAIVALGESFYQLGAFELALVQFEREEIEKK
jgi:hypothetical protein